MKFSEIYKSFDERDETLMIDLRELFSGDDKSCFKLRKRTAYAVSLSLSLMTDEVF